MTDPLALFWVHEIVVETYAGQGAWEGDDGEWDDPVVHPAFVEDGLKLVASGDGEQAISTARVALPHSVGVIRVNSKVTLPPEFGSRVCRVLSCTVADGGGLPTPDHVLLSLF